MQADFCVTAARLSLPKHQQSTFFLPRMKMCGADVAQCAFAANPVAAAQSVLHVV